MQEKPDNSFADNLRIKLCKLFLHCVFSNPEFIKGEIEKHLEIPEGGVKLRYERNRTDEQGNEYRLEITHAKKYGHDGE